VALVPTACGPRDPDGTATPPTARPAFAEYPVVDVTLASGSFHAPESIPGGLTRVRFRNDGTSEQELMFMWLNEGATFEQLQAAYQNPVFAEGKAELLAIATASGGTSYVRSGGSAEVVLDLEPGLHVLVSHNFGAPPKLQMQVTKTPLPQPPKPPAQATVVMSDFAFDAPDVLPAGTTIVEVMNAGHQLHWMEVRRIGQEDATADEVRQSLDAADTKLLPFSTAFGGMGELPPGGSAWAILDLDPGVYLVVCGVSDNGPGSTGTDEQHFQLGMYHVFTVE
jgi:hypothetical protein